MDDVLQWSAVTLVGLVLWAIARWSARISSARLGHATGHLDSQTSASRQADHETSAKAPDAALRLTYRGVSYLRWR